MSDFGIGSPGLIPSRGKGVKHFHLLHSISLIEYMHTADQFLTENMPIEKFKLVKLFLFLNGF